ncbi:helix-turn-helix domain-containing protein [Aquimarina aggregata]|uniref:helix-turn-helix domain-containing protein n=1 Tax=Aquimarina aggregata TaxID=1642818 RepID=UPI0008366373|nr:helix-turn-helix domain-containing protein [Aquimarina aggregata]
MRVSYWLIILVCSVTSVYSAEQQKSIYNSSSDSLSNKTLQELGTLFWRGIHHNSIVKRTLADYYMYRAKKENNIENIADGYQMFISIYKKQPDIALCYTDSIIELTKDTQNSRYPSTGYKIKGNILSKIDRYNEALEAYLIAQKYSEKMNNERQLIGLKHNIAILKTTLGKEREALKVYKENYEYFSKQDSVIKLSQIYIATLYKMSDSYNRLKYYDSAYFYLKKGIKASLLNPYRRYYPNLLFAYGANSYERKNYQSAIDSLQKALILSEEDVNDINVKKGYLFLAKTYLELKKESKALHYLKKLDAITNDSNYRIEIAEAFTLLIDYYKRSNDPKNQLRIMEKLLKYDSISDIKYAKLNNSLIKKYDTPKLIKDKDLLIDGIKNSNKILVYKLIAFGVFLITIIGFFYFYFSKKRKDKYNVLLGAEKQKVKVLQQKNVKSVKTSVELPLELKQGILEKLTNFEDDLEFLKNDLTLVKVSKRLKTNSTYLSKVINMEKQKNFANYINDLRIEYCKHKIKNDKKFRQYSIRSMAVEIGFNNIQSFAKAFSKKEGCNPVEYVKRFKN